MMKRRLLAHQFVKEFNEEKEMSFITCRVRTSEVGDVGRHIGTFISDPHSSTPLMEMFEAVGGTNDAYINMSLRDYFGVTGSINIECIDMSVAHSIYRVCIHLTNSSHELIMHINDHIVLDAKKEKELLSFKDTVKWLMDQIAPRLIKNTNRTVSIIPTNVYIPRITNVKVNYLGVTDTLENILECERVTIQNGKFVVEVKEEVEEVINENLPGVGYGSIRFGLFENAYVMSELKTADNNYLSGKISLNIEIDKYLEESAGDTKAILRDLLIVYLGSKNCICGSDIFIPNIDNVKVSATSSVDELRYTTSEEYTIKELFPNRSLSILSGRLIDTTNMNLEKLMGLFSGDELKTVLNEYVRLQMKVTELDIANNSEETCRRWNNPLTK